MLGAFSKPRCLPTFVLSALLASCAGSTAPRQEPFTPIPPQPIPVTEAGNAPVWQAVSQAKEPERLTPQPLTTASFTAGSVRGLQRLGEQRLASIDGYVVRLRRREQLEGGSTAEEILVKVRKEPWCIYLKWLGQENRGREVVYDPGRFGNHVHLLSGTSGKRSSAALDHSANLFPSRYLVTEIGFEALLARFGRVVDALERGDERLGTLRQLGPIQRREFAQPVEAVIQIIPPGAERGLLRGGQRFWFFDTRARLPVLMVTQDPQGKDIEYYCYDQILFPASGFHDDDFDPDRLWAR